MKNKTLQDELRTCAFMIQMGEHIHYGRDSQLLNQAASIIDMYVEDNQKNEKITRDKSEALKEVQYALDAFLESGYFPNAHVLLEKINDVLK